MFISSVLTPANTTVFLPQQGFFVLLVAECSHSAPFKPEKVVKIAILAS